MDEELDNAVAFMVLEGDRSTYRDNLTHRHLSPFTPQKPQGNTYAIKRLIQEGDLLSSLTHSHLLLLWSGLIQSQRMKSLSHLEIWSGTKIWFRVTLIEMTLSPGIRDCV
jgi:hypothetical protein